MNCRGETWLGKMSTQTEKRSNPGTEYKGKDAQATRKQKKTKGHPGENGYGTAVTCWIL